MKVVGWDVWGTPEDVEVRPEFVGRWGDVLIGGEQRGRALFAHGEALPGDGWHIELACAEPLAVEVHDLIRECVDSPGMSRSLEFQPDMQRRRVRDIARARLAHLRHRLAPAPA